MRDLLSQNRDLSRCGIRSAEYRPDQLPTPHYRYSSCASSSAAQRSRSGSGSFVVHMVRCESGWLTVRIGRIAFTCPSTKTKLLMPLWVCSTPCALFGVGSHLSEYLKEDHVSFEGCTFG